MLSDSVPDQGLPYWELGYPRVPAPAFVRLLIGVAVVATFTGGVAAIANHTPPLHGPSRPATAAEVSTLRGATRGEQVLRTATFRMNIDAHTIGGSDSVTLRGSVDLHNDAATIAGQDGQDTVEIRYLGPTAYLHLIEGGTDQGWRQTPSSALPVVLDPRHALDPLQTVTSAVRDGTTSVDGVPVTRFSARTSLAAYLPPRDTVSADALAGLDFSELGLGDVPSRVWVDHGGAVRKVRHRIAINDVPGHDDNLTITYEVTHPGSPVHVVAPPGFAGAGQGDA